MARTTSHLRFVAVKKKAGNPIGTNLLEILVLLSCQCVKREMCKTETVLDACVASVVDVGFRLIMDFRLW